MIIVTGASKGIGKFLFDKYSCQGEEVVGIYNSTLTSGHNSSSMYQVDITDFDQVEAFYSQMESPMTELVLINCAGSSFSCFAHKANYESWRKVVDVNLIGTFNMSHHALKIMRHHGYGRIINFSSIVAKMGVPGTSAYAASKAALWGLTKALAVENASKGITVNTLNLGYFDIGMINEVSVEMQDSIKARIPMGRRFGDPDDIFEAISFIIKSSYLTGSSIDLNGGLW